MYKNVRPVFFKAMSGIHAGTGSDLGLVDLPIQRERHTGLPKIESSGIKGCIREEFEQLANGELPGDFVTVTFGPEDDGDKHAGSVAFTDARLLLFPVRSAKGVFAYATCPYILKRLAEDLSLAGIAVDPVPETGNAQVAGNKLFILKSGSVVLEEFKIEAEQTEYAGKLAEDISIWLDLDDPKYIKENLIILQDDDFRDFALNNTEVITRTKIDNKTGTVVNGALFTEEFLPAETVMYSLVMTSKIFMDKETRADSDTVKIATAAGADDSGYLINTIAGRLPKYIQLGGDATIGKGLCRVNMEAVK